MKIVVITGEEFMINCCISHGSELKKFQMSLLIFMVLVEELLKEGIQNF